MPTGTALMEQQSHSPPEALEIYSKMMLYVVFAVLATVSAHHERAIPTRAIVKLVGDGIEGNITFTQRSEGSVQVLGTITGLPAGHYGFHVHEKGDITGGCGSTGSHFNPDHKDHGHPSDHNRHVGDLGNAVFDENRVSKIDFEDNFLSLFGEHSILGRAVVLHERSDDFGRSAHPDSKTTGNAGGRVACGVIGRLS